MLTAYKQPQILSRIFTDPSGRQFRLTFVIVMIDGELKGRLIDVQPISEPSFVYSQLTGTISDDTLYLPVFNLKNTLPTKYIPAFTPIVSPYIELYFLTSQPTRAPSSL
jgi:hypothetical protein